MLAVSLVLLLGAGVAWLGLPGVDVPLLTRRGGTERAAAFTGSGHFGVAAGSSLASLSPRELDARLDAVRALGVGRVRFDVEWSNVEGAGPGVYDWTAYDRVVRAAVSHGLRPLVILDYTPPWARAPECADRSACRPRDPATFGAFARAAAARYAPLGVHDWEIWNEPNIPVFFAPAPDAGAYTDLLKAAYPAIKGVDPKAEVITGGTAPTTTAANGATVKAPDFLEGIYAHGGGGYFDAVAHHPYTYPYTPAKSRPGDAWSDLLVIREVMSAHGDAGKQIWVTEYGAPTGGPGPLISRDENGTSEGGAHVTEALQALLVTTTLDIYRSYPWAGPFFWYSIQDDPPDPSSVENYFGLLRADGSRKPAYDAFRRGVER